MSVHEALLLARRLAPGRGQIQLRCTRLGAGRTLLFHPQLAACMSLQLAAMRHDSPAGDPPHSPDSTLSPTVAPPANTRRTGDSLQQCLEDTAGRHCLPAWQRHPHPQATPKTTQASGTGHLSATQNAEILYRALCVQPGCGKPPGAGGGMGQWGWALGQPQSARTVQLPSCLTWQRHVSTGPQDPSSAQEQVSMEALGGEHSGVVVLSLLRPSSRNAIGRVLLAQLLGHIRTLQGALSSPPAGQEPRTPPPRVLILKSDLPGVFSAGADLKERRGMTAQQAGEFVDALRDTFTLLEGLPLPTIAAVEGQALGGGLELALACDIRVCGSSALLALPETALAIIPGAGGTQRLPRLVGRALAKELVFTGRRVGAEEAQRIGLANYVTPEGESFPKSLELAKEMLPKGPLALRFAKHAVDLGMDLEIAAGLSLERGCYLEILQTEDRLEGLKAFAEKRSPQFVGK